MQQYIIVVALKYVKYFETCHGSFIILFNFKHKSSHIFALYPILVNTILGIEGLFRVATAQGKQGIWFLLFPDRENTGNFVLTQGKI